MKKTTLLFAIILCPLAADAHDFDEQQETNTMTISTAEASQLSETEPQESIVYDNDSSYNVVFSWGKKKAKNCTATGRGLAWVL